MGKFRKDWPDQVQQLPRYAIQRAYRSRLDGNRYLGRVEMPASLVATLIDSGFLTETDAFDYRKRGDALLRYFNAQRKKGSPNGKT